VNRAGKFHSMTEGLPSTAVDLARQYLDALQRRDPDAMGSLMAPDFVLEVPLHESGDNDPNRMRAWHGRDEAVANYKRAFAELTTVLLRELVLYPTDDPTVAFGEAFGEMRTTMGRPYKNRYAFRFDLEGGKVRRLREYCNPVTSAISFDRPLPSTGSESPRL
jgi:ketosteroid isomerase-like protein